MTDFFQSLLRDVPPVARIIISVALMLFLGFLMTRLTKLVRLPNVTAYIITGIIIGPYVLNMIPQGVIDGMDFLSDIALAFIAFSTGEFFKLSEFKKNGAKVVVITLLEALLASVLVFVVAHLILGLDMAFSVVLAALASATAPASTLMTIRQTGAKGDFVNTLLQVVALDDLTGYGDAALAVDALEHRVVVYYDLSHAILVAYIEEHYAAVVADILYPAGETSLFSYISLPQISAGNGAIDVSFHVSYSFRFFKCLSGFSR